MADLVEQLDAALDLRLVAFFYHKMHGRQPAGYWHAPGAVTLLGDGDATLATAAQWGAVVAAEPRGDGIAELRSITRLAERATADLAALAPGAGGAAGGDRPAWAVEPLAVLWALRESGYPIGGATLTIQTDIPQGSGSAVSVAVACATSLALRDLYKLDVPDRDLIGLVHIGLRAFSVSGSGPGAVAASMLLGDGQAMACDGGSYKLLPFGLAGARLRLLIIDTRVRHELAWAKWADAAESDSGEHGFVRKAAASLRSGDIHRLGPLLTAAHDIAREAGRSSPEQDVAVTAALGAGALGARMAVDATGRPVIALARAKDVRAVRAAITRAFSQRGWRTPRFVTTATVRRACRVA